MSALRSVFLATLLAGCASEERELPACLTPPPNPGGTEATMIAVGDLALCENPAGEKLATMIDAMPGTVAVLGDNVYEAGSLDEFLDCYEPTWGRHRARTRPAVGNHEYRTPHAGAYFAYFCGLSGETYKGWYSYDLGAWHVVVLNSNCGDVGCDVDSEQARWLRADLAAHPSRCTLAYFHHPRFNSGAHGAESRVAPLWDALHAAGAELVLNGHEHAYERFAPQTPSATRDDARGIVEIIVGTGGRSPSALRGTQPNSVLRLAGSWAALLALDLHESGWDFRLVREDGTVLDSGHGDCH